MGDNIVASFTGAGKGKVLLMAHIDTVFPRGTAAARPFRIEGDRAYGPGVSDDKAGIVVALTVLKILDDLKFKDYARITLFLNTNEETGSRGSRALIERLASEHDVTLNLEAGRAGDGIVIWRKGSAPSRSRSRAAPRTPAARRSSGRNAAMELAHQMLQLGKLADRGTRAPRSTSPCCRPATARTSSRIARWRTRDVRALVSRGVRPGRARACRGCRRTSSSPTPR